MYTTSFCAGLPAVLCQLDCTDQVFGNENETEYTEATDTTVYLNLNDPANCSGTLSSYRYCHYPTMDASLTYNSILAVFRLVGSNYVAVGGSDVLITGMITEAFSCVTLPFLGTVQTEPGDIVGACVGPRQGGNNRRQLNLAGNDAIGFSVRGASRSGCPTIDLNSVTVMTSELMVFPDRILHLSAEFGELLDSTILMQ